MDGNKDEAARCVQIAVGVLRSGDKQRALKFIRIAQRLDRDVPIGDFLAVLEDLDHSRVVGNGEEFAKDFNGEKSYGDEHVKLIRDIKKKKDYYSILGVGRSCSAEEIKKAYRKLSLKVHPDKNRAPGAEEAFKIVCKAFNCLSDEESRRCYDRVGHIGDDVFGCEDDYARRMRRRSRRRATPAGGHAFDDNIDPNEFFRNFMHGMKDDVFRVRRARKTREVPDQHRELNGHRGVFTLVVIFQIMLIMICLLFVYFPYSEPQYALQKTYAYHIPMVMEKHDVEFFVKSEDFEEQFPRGSAARVELEKKVLRDYKGVLSRYCHLELQRRRWVKDTPKPHCDRLRSLAVA